MFQVSGTILLGIFGQFCFPKPGEGETDKDRASRNGSLKQKFVDIAETMDEDLEKGAKEALSPKKETSEDKDKDDVISSLQKQLEVRSFGITFRSLDTN